MGVSYTTQHLCHGVYIMIGGLILSMLLCVPSWPFYNRNQLTWLKHKEEKKAKKE
jgi:signal peptidase complex subunit 1